VWYWGVVYAMCRLVFLKQFMTFLITELWNVNVTRFLLLYLCMVRMFFVLTEFLCSLKCLKTFSASVDIYRGACASVYFFLISTSDFYLTMAQ
jgi:hypothetical protein